MKALEEINAMVKTAYVGEKRLEASNLRRNATTSPGIQQGLGFGYGMHPYDPSAGAVQASGTGSPTATASAQAGAPAKASRGFGFSVPKKAPVGSVGQVKDYAAYKQQMADIINGHRANTALGASQRQAIAAQLRRINNGVKDGMTPEQYRRALYQARRVGANGTFSFGRGSQGGAANMSNPNYRQAFVNGRRVGAIKVNTTSDSPETDSRGNLTAGAKVNGWNQFAPGIHYKGKDRATRNFAARMANRAWYDGVLSGTRMTPQQQRDAEKLLADYKLDRI